MSMCGSQSENSLRYTSSGDTNFIFGKGSLIGIKLTNSLAPGWPANPGDPLPILTFPVLGFEACTTLHFYISIGSGEPSPGSCVTSTL